LWRHQDGCGEADAHHLEIDLIERCEDREHRDHHDRGAGHDARGCLDAVGYGVLAAHPAVVGLAHAAEDEDVVVHREAEHDHGVAFGGSEAFDLLAKGLGAGFNGLLFLVVEVAAPQPGGSSRL
jgi:hypothetical protein